MFNPRKIVSELVNAPCYRSSPLASVQNLYARWLFSRSRKETPAEFLSELGVNPATALSGFDRWQSALQAALEKVSTKRDGQGGVSLKDGMILFGLVRALQPEFVVETGIAAGISTSFLAAALIENGHGHLHSIELPVTPNDDLSMSDGSRYAWQEHGVGWAIPEGIRRSLDGNHSIVLCDVRQALPQILARLPRVDLFFHDDLHTPDHMLWEYELVWRHLAPGGVLLSDDSNYGWIEFCRRQRLGNQFKNVDRLCGVRKPLIASSQNGKH